MKICCTLFIIMLCCGCATSQPQPTPTIDLASQLVVQPTTGTNMINQPAKNDILFVGDTVHVSAVLGEPNIHTIYVMLIPVVNNKLEHRAKRTWFYKVSNPQPNPIEIELDFVIPNDMMPSDDYRLQIGTVINQGTASGYSQMVRIRKR
ncbi:MAG: hypothetical protein KAX40_06870 [Herpetosiphon sp.]|nr:hypothetical protein [Herpetosiphon sp.]